MAFGNATKGDLKKISGGGGSGGTSNYNDLSNKPSINGVELIGNKTSSDLLISGSVSFDTLAATDTTFSTSTELTLTEGLYLVKLSNNDNPVKTALHIIDTSKLATGECIIMDICVSQYSSAISYQKTATGLLFKEIVSEGTGFSAINSVKFYK